MAPVSPVQIDKTMVDAILNTLRSWSATQSTVISILNDNREILSAVGAWNTVEEILADSAATYFDQLLPLVFGEVADVDLSTLRAKILTLTTPYADFYAKTHSARA